MVFVDADDTLWENNLHFERVIRGWVTFMECQGVAPERAEAALHAAEERNIPIHGYGAGPFVHSVRDAFRDLVPHATPAQQDALEDLAHASEAAIRDHEIVLLPGVDTALATLGRDERVVIVTKGQADEQLVKVERSGLRQHVEDVFVVDEKHIGTYRDAAARVGCHPGDCWMIGNSPRSDINPARLAGLRTVYVPHPAPWHREAQPWVTAGIPHLTAASFADVPARLRAT